MAGRGPKVFGIGFQKTGTSSLHTALGILGYDVNKGVFINTPDKHGLSIEPPLTNGKVFARVLPIAEAREAFSDNPWPLLFHELDERFPGSKFILTVRESGRWIESLVRHFGDEPGDMLQWAYGCPSVLGHEARCLAGYEAHNATVRAHFAGRPGALLEIDLERNAGWNAICAFLGKPVPRKPFPHANPASERERKQASAWRWVKDRLRSRTTRV